MQLTNFDVHEITDEKQRDELNEKLKDAEFVQTDPRCWIAEFDIDGVAYAAGIRIGHRAEMTSLTQFVRTALERYLDELAKQKITANITAGKPKQVSLILETPVALWTLAEKEFADEVIQRHFDDDR